MKIEAFILVFWKNKPKCFLKLNHFQLTYDTQKDYSYGYNRFISEGCLVLWGQNPIYNKIILNRVFHLSTILAGSEIVWNIEQDQK